MIATPLLGLVALLPSPQEVEPPARERWSQELGQGFSAPTLQGDTVFVSYRVPGDENVTVRALDLEDGTTRWETAFPDAARDGQEDYGGGRGPHAAPVWAEGTVFALGYAGRLVALDAETGSTRWERDAVEELGAKPVQFGFAAAPLVSDGRLFLLSGGAAGVVSLDPATGEELWRSPARGATYVTPVLASLAGVEQLLCVFESETVGIDPASGEELWVVPHVRPEQTNYAMLLLGEDDSLFVSGQGQRGTRRIDVQRRDGTWSASVGWHARAVQFSHGRLVARDGLLIGSNGSMLCALVQADGSLAYKLRGFDEANLVAAGARHWLVDQEGTASLLVLTPERVDVLARVPLLESRAWAPPVALDDGLLARDAGRIVRLECVQEAAAPVVLESFATGYEPGRVRVAPALLAFAEGRYRAASGETLRLIATDEGLRLEEPGRQPVALAPRSEERFEGQGVVLTLRREEGVVPEGLSVARAGETRAATRLPLEPLAHQPERMLGGWSVSGSFEVVLRVGGENLEATSSAYPDVLFDVLVESERRAWLTARDAPYGIPDVLMVFPSDDAALVHQANETRTATRSEAPPR